jgi:GNAT superfamily N-acetyltransferase
MNDEALLRLEAIAFRSWPAATVAQYRGMLLRHTGGESRRANSAAVHACDPSLSIADIVRAGESFYASHGRPPFFQLGPTAPAGLDAALASRGYTVEAPVWVQTAALATLSTRRSPARASPPGSPADRGREAIETCVTATPDEGWIDIEIARGRYADIRSTFLDILARLAPRAGFATARIGGAPVAAGLFVHDGDVVVFAAMRTLPEARRRGAARALVHAGVTWALERGASLGYLQVERDNEAALALYASEGFATIYGYAYRARPPR